MSLFGIGNKTLYAIFACRSAARNNLWEAVEEDEENEDGKTTNEVH